MFVSHTDRMTAELLLELNPALQLRVRLLLEAFRAQTEQLLQAEHQPLVVLLQLHAAPQLLAAGVNTSECTVQLTLHMEKDRQFEDSDMHVAT